MSSRLTDSPFPRRLYPIVKTKKFLSSQGIPIIVGQDDESNDHLTFKIANPNDIWLHVGGVPGSHVLLRCGQAGKDADKASIKEAAGLAAYFSKMRSGGKVTVHYCFAKQVSKPARAQAGSVTIKQFKKIRVRPQTREETL